MADHTQIEDILQRGIEFQRQQQFLEAEACYKEVLGIDPNNADAIHLLGLLADSIGDKDLAIDLIKIAISFAPSSAIFHGNLANILKLRGETDNAIFHYSEALRLDPGLAEPAFNLANLYRDQGRLEEAVQLYQQATAINQDFAIAWINMADALVELGKSEEAIFCYQRHQELKPDDIYSRTRLADIYFNLGQQQEGLGLLNEAASFYEKALTVLPHHTASRKKLDILLNKGNPNAFTGTLSPPPQSPYFEALRLNPAYSETCIKLGTLYRSFGKSDQSANCFRKAIELDPNSAQAYFELAEVLYMSNELDEAICFYKRYLEFKADDIECRSRLANALFERGLKFEADALNDDAAICFEEAISFLPSHDASREKLFSTAFQKSVSDSGHKRLGNSITQLGVGFHVNSDFAEARTHYLQALDINPENVLAKELIALLPDVGETGDLSVESFKELIDLEPCQTAQANAELAVPQATLALSKNLIDHFMQPAHHILQNGGYTFTHLMYYIWAARLDLQNSFDIYLPDERLEYCKWFLMRSDVEYKLTPSCYPRNMLEKLITFAGIVGKKARSILASQTQLDKA